MDISIRFLPQPAKNVILDVRLAINKNAFLVKVQ
jgi:hypothetical protein